MVGKNQIKLITSLQRKKYRMRHGLFIAEGEKVIRELATAGFEAEMLFETEPVLKGISSKITTIIEFDLKKISALSSPNNCLGVFRIPDPKPIKVGGIIVALDDIRDPGNLGTIVRLCDWFGIGQIVCSTETADIYNPKTVQATMGSLARVQVCYVDLEKFISEINVPVYGTFMDGETIYSTDLPANAVIIFGNEANGISSEMEKLVQNRISIPRFGHIQKTESLNVATAAAIILSEFRRK